MPLQPPVRRRSRRVRRAAKRKGGPSSRSPTRARPKSSALDEKRTLLGKLLEHPEELFTPVAAFTREVDELLRPDEHLAAAGTATHRDAAAAPELEQAFVAQHP